MLLASSFVCYRGDVTGYFADWARATHGLHPALIYCAAPLPCNYPPVIPYILTAIERLTLSTHISDVSRFGVPLIKLPNIVSILLGAALCRLGLQRVFGESASRRAATC
jgi:hypothetical protein